MLTIGRELALGSAHRFARAVGLDGKRMHLAFELGGQNLVDQAVAFYARLASERRRHDEHAKMALAGAGRAAMAGVEVGLIDDLEARWLQRLAQLLADRRLDGH